jgi:hypothetical protein
VFADDRGEASPGRDKLRRCHSVVYPGSVHFVGKAKEDRDSQLVDSGEFTGPEVDGGPVQQGEFVIWHQRNLEDRACTPGSGGV